MPCNNISSLHMHRDGQDNCYYSPGPRTSVSSYCLSYASILLESGALSTLCLLFIFFAVALQMMAHHSHEFCIGSPGNPRVLWAAPSRCAHAVALLPSPPPSLSLPLPTPPPNSHPHPIAERNPTSPTPRAPRYAAVGALRTITAPPFAIHRVLAGITAMARGTLIPQPYASVLTPLVHRGRSAVPGALRLPSPPTPYGDPI